jgi:transcriptional regulator with GAF, ATPase, and Fis domain
LQDNKKMQAANTNKFHVFDAQRLEALKKTRLLDALPEERYDRLTRLAAKLTGAPVALISLVDGKRQFFKSQQGLQKPWTINRETPLSHSFCRHVVDSKQPLVIQDARKHAFLSANLAVKELGVIAYLGVPLKLSDDCVLGALCVIDTKPHVWSEEDIENLRDIADLVLDEISLHQTIDSAADDKKRMTRAQKMLSVLAKESQLGLWTWDIAAQRVALDEMAQVIFEIENTGISFYDFLAAFCEEDRPRAAVALLHAGQPGNIEEFHLLASVTGAVSGKKKCIEISGRQPVAAPEPYIAGTLRELTPVD